MVRSLKYFFSTQRVVMLLADVFLGLVLEESWMLHLGLWVLNSTGTKRMFFDENSRKSRWMEGNFATFLLTLKNCCETLRTLKNLAGLSPECSYNYSTFPVYLKQQMSVHQQLLSSAKYWSHFTDMGCILLSDLHVYVFVETELSPFSVSYTAQAKMKWGWKENYRSQLGMELKFCGMGAYWSETGGSESEIRGNECDECSFCSIQVSTVVCMWCSVPLFRARWQLLLRRRCRQLFTDIECCRSQVGRRRLCRLSS